MAMNLDRTIPEGIAMVTSEARKDRKTIMRARALIIARIAWPIYVALLMSVFLAALQVRYLELTGPSQAIRDGLTSLGLSTGFYATYNLTAEALYVLVFAGVAAIVYARNADDWMGIFTAYTLVTFGVASPPLLVTLESLIDYDAIWTMPVRLLRFGAWSLILLLFYLFPDGKWVHPRMRWLVIGTILVIQVPWNMFPESPLSPWRWPWTEHLMALAATWGPAVYAQVLRYMKMDDPVRRLQTKWFVFGSAAAVVGAIGGMMPRLADHTLNDPSTPAGLQYILLSTAVVYACTMLLPASIGISIMRYRLWDIDLIINKTLVYIPLTGILAGMYAASIRIFQTFFESVLGTNSDIAVVLTTLVLASTFTPIKNALQEAVDRRFKSPPAPSAKLHSLIEEMRMFVDLNNSSQIARRVMEDVTRAFAARGGAVYMLRDGEHQLAYTFGHWHESEAALSAPVVCDGRDFGVIKLTGRADGEPFTEQDESTLREVVTLLACTMAVSVPTPAQAGVQ
jgi:hypothetical protein